MKKFDSSGNALKNDSVLKNYSYANPKSFSNNSSVVLLFSICSVNFFLAISSFTMVNYPTVLKLQIVPDWLILLNLLVRDEKI